MTEACVTCSERLRADGLRQCAECDKASKALNRYWWDHGMRLSAARSLWAARHLAFLCEESRREA